MCLLKEEKPYRSYARHPDYIIHHYRGLAHRRDGPAIIWSDGDEWWLLYGQIHRDDGSAYKPGDGREEFNDGGHWKHGISGMGVSEKNDLPFMCYITDNTVHRFKVTKQPYYHGIDVSKKLVDDEWDLDFDRHKDEDIWKKSWS